MALTQRRAQGVAHGDAPSLSDRDNVQVRGVKSLSGLFGGTAVVEAGLCAINAEGEASESRHSEEQMSCTHDCPLQRERSRRLQGGESLACEDLLTRHLQVEHTHEHQSSRAADTDPVRPSLWRK